MTPRTARPRRIGRARLGAAALLLIAAVAAAGCAPLPPARAVTDINMVVGRWRGQITFGRGPYELFYLTINPEGTLVASWDAVTRYGKVTLESGRARFSVFIWSGALDYLEGGGERVILLKEDFGHWDAIVRPLN